MKKEKRALFLHYLRCFLGYFPLSEGFLNEFIFFVQECFYGNEELFFEILDYDFDDDKIRVMYEPSHFLESEELFDETFDDDRRTKLIERIGYDSASNINDLALLFYQLQEYLTEIAAEKLHGYARILQ